MKSKTIGGHFWPTSQAALLIILFIAFLIGTPTNGRACGWCLNLSNSFTLGHPKSIEIALATRAAIEKGVLQPRHLVSTKLALGEGEGVIALKKIPASALARTWLATLKLRDSANPLSVHILLIDTRENCGIEIRRGIVLVQAKPSMHSDVKIAMTKETLLALATKKMELHTAKKLGLLVTEGDGHKLVKQDSGN